LARLHAFLAPVNPAAAAAVLVKLTAAPDMLVNQPRLGSTLPDFAPRDVRRWLVGDYELRYELVGDALWVLSLWHTREDR
jgi:plasmid stabilization system protein ParE